MDVRQVNFANGCAPRRGVAQSHAGMGISGRVIMMKSMPSLGGPLDALEHSVSQLLWNT